MIKLHGVRISNYYNMVKFALLEKGIDFEEVTTMPSQEGDFKSMSPMGKVPCLETEHGFLSETTAILEYLEAIQPSPALMPADAFAAAKVREVMKVLELYFDLQGRRHFPEIFFGGERNANACEEAKPVLENGIIALKSLASFNPYICGEFSYADIMASHTFVYTALVCQAVHDWDIIAEIPGLQATIDSTNARLAGAKVHADHQAAVEAFMAG